MHLSRKPGNAGPPRAHHPVVRGERDRHTPCATNDVKVGGGFNFRMEARNKSGGFDFQGSYALVNPRGHIHSLLGDGRHLDIRFTPEADRVRIVEEFDTETWTIIPVHPGSQPADPGMPSPCWAIGTTVPFSTHIEYAEREIALDHAIGRA